VTTGPVAVGFLVLLLLSGSVAAARSAEPTSDIYSIALDGSERRNVTNTARVSEGFFGLSSDGKRLAFFQADSLMTVSADGEGLRRLASYSQDDNFAAPPKWSADGRRIAYEQGFSCTGAVCGRSEVWVTEADSGSSRRLAKKAVQPAWSPGGSSIAYTHAQLRTDGREPIYHLSVVLSRADGSAARTFQRDAETPAWSPTGRYLAYLGHNGFGPTRVYRERRTGSERHRLPSPFDPSVVSWSPDGRRIAIVGGVLPTLYVVRANGHGFHSLGRLDQEEGFSWSPDGRRLAWPRGRRIVIAEAVGGSRTEIAVGTPVVQVIWSTDGTRLFFVA
jgi:Tol biopolymer transport system component